MKVELCEGGGEGEAGDPSLAFVVVVVVPGGPDPLSSFRSLFSALSSTPAAGSGCKKRVSRTLLRGRRHRREGDARGASSDACTCGRSWFGGVINGKGRPCAVTNRSVVSNSAAKS